METPARCCVREDVLLEHQNACCAMGCAKVDAGAFSAEEEAEDSSTFILYINLNSPYFFEGYHLLYTTFRVHGRQIALPPQHMVHTLCARSDRGRLRIHATLFWKTQIANTHQLFMSQQDCRSVNSYILYTVYCIWLWSGHRFVFRNTPCCTFRAAPLSTPA